MGSRLHKAIIIFMLLCLFVGVFLRFIYPYGFEFKEDEANALILANQAIKSHIIPLQGLISSLNIPNPPFLIYSIIPFTYIFSGAIFITYLFVIANLVAMFITFFFVRRYFSKRASLYTLCFYAVSTWALIMSRKIWAQSLLPLFSISVLFSVFLFMEKKRFFYSVLASLFASFAFGMHYSGAVLVFMTFIYGYFVSRGLRKKYFSGLFLGYACSLVLWYPFLVHFFDLLKNNAVHVRGAGFSLFNIKAIAYPLAYVSNWSINDLLSIEGGTAFRKFLGIPLFALFHVFSITLVFLYAYSLYRAFKEKETKYKLILISVILPSCVLLFTKAVFVFYFIVATPSIFILMGSAFEFMRNRHQIIIAVSIFFLLVFNFLLLLFLNNAEYYHGNIKVPIGRTYELKNYIKDHIDCPRLNYVDKEVPVYVSYVLNRTSYKCSDKKKDKKNIYISFAVEGKGEDFRYPNTQKIGPYKLGWE
jgi:hypothetical protein